ncbi:hypothetical protein BTHER_12105 [Brochothrix thermosphacta DSM 20171 = FSL F6-1036]|nr:hypothetical protein BTHER_12105 [Brochothrix thermosphacta DSM 20171 = FSL F6-1036]
MSKTQRNLIKLILFLIFMLVLSVAITDKYYLLISLLFLVATMVPLYRRFENKKNSIT